MAAVLRLQRVGKHRQPYYRMVAIDKRSGPAGRPLEILGIYDPRGDKAKDKIQLNADRVSYWLGVGAKPSETVLSLIRLAKRAAAAAKPAE
ncbi:MAG: 30S ribosomal protein S16 [Elusimicrobia bacterium]|nr:30S ribosomal protein S16 [Elusimicrobiota bacterium]